MASSIRLGGSTIGVGRQQRRHGRADGLGHPDPRRHGDRRQRPTRPSAPMWRSKPGVSPGSAPICRRTPARIVDAGGLTVTPGFIDIKTHSDFVLPINPKAESKVRQGVTTEIIGHCGFSVAPVLPGKTQLLADYLSGGAPWLPFREMSFPDYLDTFSGRFGQCRDAGRPQHAAADGDGARRPRADRGRVRADGRAARRRAGGGRARVLVGPLHPARQLRRARRADAPVRSGEAPQGWLLHPHPRRVGRRHRGGGGGDRGRPRPRHPCRDRPSQMLGHGQLGQGGDCARHDRAGPRRGAATSIATPIPMPPAPTR